MLRVRVFSALPLRAQCLCGAIQDRPSKTAETQSTQRKRREELELRRNCNDDALERRDARYNNSLR